MHSLQMPWGWHHDGMLMGWHWLWWLFWIVVVVLVVWALGRFLREDRGTDRRVTDGEDPEEVLRRRFSRGELDEEEFRRRLRVLRESRDETEE